jgi:hypothetical protein
MPTPRSQLIAFPIGNKENVFATAISDANLLTWIPANKVDFPHIQIRYRDNAKDINGQLGPTERQVEHIKGGKAWSFDASAETLGWGLSMQHGNIAVAGSGDPWSLTTKWRSLCSINPPSFSYFHGLNCAGATGTFFKRKGVVIAKQTIEIKGKGPVIQTMALEDDGTLTADPSFSVPANPTPVKKLIGANALVQFGAPGSLVDLSGARRIRECKIDMTSGIQDVETPNNSVSVDEYQYGEMDPVITVEMIVKGDESSAEYAFYTAPGQGATAPTLVQLVVTLDPGVNPARSLMMTMTNAHVIDIQPKPQKNETQLHLKLGPVYNSTDSGPAQFLSKMGQATFLVGA